jgi:hypothetical protein
MALLIMIGERRASIGRFLRIFKTLSNCDLGACRYFFQGIFLLGKRP